VFYCIYVVVVLLYLTILLMKRPVCPEKHNQHEALIKLSNGGSYNEAFTRLSHGGAYSNIERSRYSPELSNVRWLKRKKELVKRNIQQGRQTTATVMQESGSTSKSAAYRNFSTMYGATISA